MGRGEGRLNEHTPSCQGFERAWTYSGGEREMVQGLVQFSQDFSEVKKTHKGKTHFCRGPGPEIVPTWGAILQAWQDSSAGGQDPK